jgi:hypothetical protein
VLAVASRLALGPGAIGYDASFALLWGDELTRLERPDFDARFTPTPHPLANLAGAVASLFGRSGPEVLLALSHLSLAGVGVAAFLVGLRTFGTIAGLALAAILLTRPLLVEGTLQASVDVPFLALVLAALAVALRAEGRGGGAAAPGAEGRERGSGAEARAGGAARAAPVLVLLALAGLLRPEAWLLAAAYAAWTWSRGERRAGTIALAAAAPALWLLHDLVLAGDPFHSLTGTQDLAVQLERERGLASAADVLPESLEAILRPGVMWTGLAVGIVVLAVAQERALLPFAALGAGLAGFLVLGVFDLPLLIRYLLVPAAMVALLTAAGVAAATWLRPRPLGAAATVATVVAVLSGAAKTLDVIDLRRDSADFARSVDASVRDVARRAPEGCGPVTVATNRAMPLVAYELEVRPSDIAVAPDRRDRGILFAARAPVVATDIDYDREVPGADTPLPRGFARLAASEWWSLGARC